jgi:hypothetical protein
MGRAVLLSLASRGQHNGLGCALYGNTEVRCLDGTRFAAQRAQKRTVAKTVRNDRGRRYRRDVRPTHVNFLGPGGAPTAPEVSFGALYAASLAQMLADDLRRAAGAAAVVAGAWPAATFMEDYLSGALLLKPPQQQSLTQFLRQHHSKYVPSPDPVGKAEALHQ